jgi:cell fate regulator YaaT (PSP1 superfamily)
VEYGVVAQPNKYVPDSELAAPLKSVIRKATPEDERQLIRNQEMKQEALPLAARKVAERGLNMKIVSAEYTLDRSKLIIYFTAAGRVDFRELVRDLAAVFKVRIELRQIYERDETKLLGALAPCGRPCCCNSHIDDVSKVRSTIKMAKLQGLPLNPAKLSGVCGKLMCCLSYENEYYKEMYKKMPKVGSAARTPDGEGEIEANDILRQTCKVKVRLKDGTFDVRSYDLAEIRATVTQSEPDGAGDDEEEVKE